MYSLIKCIYVYYHDEFLSIQDNTTASVIKRKKKTVSYICNNNYYYIYVCNKKKEKCKKIHIDIDRPFLSSSYIIIREYDVF